MKKKISLLLAILMLVTLIPTAFAESKTVDAVKNTKKITLDGEEVMVGAYDVEGYNYLKLRDVAAILNTKKCQFNVGFDGPTKLITVELAKGYEKVEGDLAEIKDEKAKAIVSVKKILVNGEEKEIKTALINEYNYMQLRDLGSLVGLEVKYDAKNKVIMLKSDAEEKEEKVEKNEEKKDDKKEEKTDDKKDEKKDENKSLDFTDAETAYLNKLISLYDAWLEYLETHNVDEVPEESRSIANYYSYLKNIFEAGGRPLSREYTASIYIDERKDGRYTVVEFEYPSGSTLLQEAIVTADVDGSFKNEKFNAKIINAYIIPFRKDAKKDLLNNSELIKTKFKEFYDEAMKKDYKKAAAALYELGYESNEKNVKELIELRAKNAKALKGALDIENYKYEAKKVDKSFMAKFSNEYEMFAIIYNPELDGLLTSFFK